MKKISLCGLVTLSLILLSGCSLGGLQGNQEDNYQLTIGEYTPVQDPEQITVNGEPISIANNTRLQIGDQIQDVALDQPVGEFDKIEQIFLGDLEGYSMVYSVPSLDTPVCTLQTKQIEAAADQFPEINFVIISHDTPFALERFCTDKDITNVLTLSDSRSKEFARANGLYMNEYMLMTRAVFILNNTGEIIYVDYADEVTNPVSLLNAFAFLQTLE